MSADQKKAAAIAADHNSEDELRQTLLQFFLCYSPERLMEVPMLMHRFPHDSKSAEIKLQLRRDFGQEPVADEARLCLANDFRTRLFAFYAFYAPKRFSDVDALVHKYHGREVELMDSLVRKYGEEEAVNDLFLDWTDRSPDTGYLKEREKPPPSVTPSTHSNNKHREEENECSQQRRHQKDQQHPDTNSAVPTSRTNNAMQIKGTTQALDGPPPPPSDVIGRGPRDQNDDCYSTPSLLLDAKGGAGRRVSFAQKSGVDTTNKLPHRKSVVAPSHSSSSYSPNSGGSYDYSSFGALEKSLNVSDISLGGRGVGGDGYGGDQQRDDDTFGEIPWAESGIFTPDSLRSPINERKSTHTKRAGGGGVGSHSFGTSTYSDPGGSSENDESTSPRRHTSSGRNDQNAEEENNFSWSQKPQPPAHHNSSGVYLIPAAKPKTVVPVEEDPTMSPQYRQLLAKLGVNTEALAAKHGPALKSTTARPKAAQLVYHNADDDFSPPVAMIQDTSVIHHHDNRGGVSSHGEVKFRSALDWGGGDYSSPAASSEMNGGGGVLRVPLAGARGEVSTQQQQQFSSPTKDYRRILQTAGVHTKHHEKGSRENHVMGFGSVHAEHQPRKLNFLTADDLDNL